MEVVEVGLAAAEAPVEDFGSLGFAAVSLDPEAAAVLVFEVDAAALEAEVYAVVLAVVELVV